MDGEPTAEFSDTLPHSEYTNAQHWTDLGIEGFKSNAIVLDHQVYATFLPEQSNGCLRRTGVSMDVGEGFLGQAVEGRFNRAGYLTAIANIDIDFHTRSHCESADKIMKNRRQIVCDQ